MAFNFKSYTSNNPLLQEVEEEISVSSSGVEMEEANFSRADFESAVKQAIAAGIDKFTLHKIIDWS